MNNARSATKSILVISSVLKNLIFCLNLSKEKYNAVYQTFLPYKYLNNKVIY